MVENFFARSVKEKPTKEPQRLIDHLTHVAARAREFSESFEWSNWAYAAGLLHDIGKYSMEFQDYLRSKKNEEQKRKKGPDHSTAGAREATKIFNKKLGKIIAYGMVVFCLCFIFWVVRWLWNIAKNF